MSLNWFCQCKNWFHLFQSVPFVHFLVVSLDGSFSAVQLLQCMHLFVTRHACCNSVLSSHARNWLVKMSFCHRLAGSKWHSALWIHATVDTVHVESFWEVMGSNLNGQKDSVSSHCNVSPLPRGKTHCDCAASAQWSIRKQEPTPSNDRTSNGHWWCGVNNQRLNRTIPTLLSVDAHSLANCVMLDTHAMQNAVCSDCSSLLRLVKMKWQSSCGESVWFTLKFPSKRMKFQQGTALKCSAFYSHHPHTSVNWQPLRVTQPVQSPRDSTCTWIVGERKRSIAQWNSSGSCTKKLTHPPHHWACQRFWQSKPALLTD